MGKAAIFGVKTQTVCAINPYLATITVWEWFVGRTDTVWTGWISMSVHVIKALLGEYVRLTSTIVRESTAVEMAGALMARATFSVSVTLATLVCCVRFLMQDLVLKLKEISF